MGYRAYSPGSVTLFFRIVENEDPRKMGSLGVGVCVDPGAITEIKEGEGIFLNGQKIEGPIQRKVMEMFGFQGQVETTIALPVSQGFGMSGAIALSTSLALASKFRKTYFEAAEIAHVAEVTMGTGLGDVASEFEGGFTIRTSPGIQPFGVVDRIHYGGKINLFVFGEPINTREIITNKKFREKIIEEGEYAMRRFMKKRTFDNALAIARDFSLELGVMSPSLRDFIENCENSTQALLGNSAIVFGECRDIPDNAQSFQVSLGSRARILR